MVHRVPERGRVASGRQNLSNTIISLAGGLGGFSMLNTIVPQVKRKDKFSHFYRFPGNFPLKLTI
jgi:hypothetical protein